MHSAFFLLPAKTMHSFVLHSIGTMSWPVVALRHPRARRIASSDPTIPTYLQFETIILAAQGPHLFSQVCRVHSLPVVLDGVGMIPLGMRLASWCLV